MAEVVIDVVGKDSFSGVLGNFGSIVTGIESAINMAGQALGFFKDQAMAGLDAVASWERLSLTMETLTAKEFLATGQFKDMASALEAAGPKAEELLQWVQELAIKSPFTTEGVANAFRTAQAYGFSADEARRLTEAMINFAAGSGQSEDAMNRIALALGQIEAKGKLSGQEVLQLVNAGLPVTQILADAFHVTTAEITKMQSEGLIPAKDAIEAITVYLETNFAGAAERQATSWAGLRSTFEDIKQIGLREFFTGMYDALQPLAIELSNFLQSEGMDNLKEWGTILGGITAGLAELVTNGKLYELGYQLQEIGGKDSVFYALGTAIKVFQQALDNGLPVMESFKIGLNKFLDLSPEIDTNVLGKIDSFVANVFNGIENKIVLWNAGNGPQELSDRIIEFLDDVGTDDGTGTETKWTAAASRLVNALIGAVGAADWDGVADAVDRNLSRAINGIDWENAGKSISTGIGNMLKSATSGSSADWNDANSDKYAWVDNIPFAIALRFGKAILTSDVVMSITNSIGKLFIGIGEGIIPPETLRRWSDQVNEFFLVTLPNKIRSASDSINKAMGEISKSMWDGIMEGLQNIPILGWWSQWVNDHIVMPIRRLLGISSPSTVFKEIGGDIVQGLWDGMKNMWGTFTGWVEDKFNALLSNLSWANIYKVITGQMSVADLFSGSGSGSTTLPYDKGATEDWPTGGTGTGGAVLTGGAVTNNFYGPVYFQGLSQAGYDCPSPHPLMQASGHSLLTSGVTP